MKKNIIFLIILITFASPIFTKFHPQIDWREIADDRFILVFPQGYETEALYTLGAARDIYDKLENFWGHGVRTRIRILISDRYDAANGSASFFPFNHIEVFLFNPEPDSTLGSYREWIDLVLTHEMTHIFNMNAGSGFTYLMRKVVGSNPIFYPMTRAPEWLIEGAAVYGESKLNPAGRLNTPDYALMLENIGNAGKIPDLAHIYGSPTDWPGPTAKYLYGAKFVEFLVERYGEDRIKGIFYNFGHHFIPRLVRHRFKKVFARSLPRLWAEFSHSINLPRADCQYLVKELSPKGMHNNYPVAGPNDRIFYAREDYQAFPGIYEFDRKNGKSRRLMKVAGVNALFYAEEEKKIYFSASQYFKSFYRFSDIYEFDLKNSSRKRLTKGRRLSYPLKAGDEIYCVKRKGTKSYLAVLNLEHGKDRTISRGFAAISHISLSPDHKYIAASLKRKNRNWSIALFDLKGELIKVMVDNDLKNFCPRWKNAHELYFIAEDQGDYKLARFDLETDTTYITQDNQLPGLNHIDSLPQKKHLVVSFFDGNGYNLGLVETAALTFEERSVMNPAAEEQEMPNPPPAGIETRRYNFFRELLPKYFTLSYRDGGNEIQPGIYLSGNDLLEKHFFSFGTYYGYKSETLNFHFDYSYDGLYPTLTLNYSDYSNLYQSKESGDYIHREQEIQVAALQPLSITDRQQAHLFVGIYFEKVEDHYEEAVKEERLNLNGIKLGFLFSSAKEYYDSISYADGIRLSVSYARDFKFLGSSYHINTFSLDFQQFLSLFRPNVLALRLGIADSWGEARRLFYLGGAKSKVGYALAGENLFDLMRGYPAGFFSGTGGFIVNLEYRLSLFKIERVFTVFRSIERLYLSLFADMGNLWLKEKRIAPSFSLGLELNLVALIADQRFNFCGGVALGQNPYHEPIFYFRLGRSF